MEGLTHGWAVDVERGPNWLFVRLTHPQNATRDETTAATVRDESLGDALWDLMRREFVGRMVLELDELPLLQSEILGQIVLLNNRVRDSGGILRLSGLSDHNNAVLQRMRLHKHVPHFRSRRDAVQAVTNRVAD